VPQYKTIGFIGLGVMGEPICRNLVKKSGAAVLAFDLAPEPLARLRAEGAGIAGSVAEIVVKSDIVLLCLPSARHARAVFEGDGILKNIRLGSVWIHLEFITPAARLIIASKLVSVLSARIAIRLNSLSLQKKFSIRCRHL